jgi:hypothetical protein
MNLLFGFAGRAFHRHHNIMLVGHWFSERLCGGFYHAPVTTTYNAQDGKRLVSVSECSPGTDEPRIEPRRTHLNFGWLADFTKPFSTTWNAVAVRLALRIGRRKPTLYVHFNSVQTVWCIAQTPQSSGPAIEYMHTVFWADLNHDDPKQTLIIVNAYPKGKKGRAVGRKICPRRPV